LNICSIIDIVSASCCEGGGICGDGGGGCIIMGWGGTLAADACIICWNIPNARCIHSICSVGLACGEGGGGICCGRGIGTGCGTGTGMG
jgi:hypothetical protein